MFSCAHDSRVRIPCGKSIDAGVTTEEDKQAKADQLHLLAEAEEVWSKAQNLAHESSATSLLAVLSSLQAGFASLHKLVEKPIDRTSEVHMRQLH